MSETRKAIAARQVRAGTYEIGPEKIGVVVERLLRELGLINKPKHDKDIDNEKA